MNDVRALAAKAARFGLVGVTNSLLYALFTALSVRELSVGPTASSVLGYVAVLPFAFFAHKMFTFRAIGDARTEMFRFVVVYVSGLAVAVLAMYVSTSVLGLSYIVGIIAAMVLVPLLSLLVLDRWVFTQQK